MTSPEPAPESYYAPLLRTQRDVEDAWRHLIQPLGWAGRGLWFLFVGADDRPLPLMNEMSDLPDELGPEDAVPAAELWRGVLDNIAPEGRVAVLLCRPEGGGPNLADRASAAALYAACRDAGVPLEVVHLATDEEFWPLPFDAVGP